MPGDIGQRFLEKEEYLAARFTRPVDRHRGQCRVPLYFAMRQHARGDEPQVRFQIEREMLASTDEPRLLAALETGSDFAKLARDHNDDPGGAEHGGDLGWIHRPTPGLSDAVRTAALLAPGAHTPVMRVPAGWVILKRDR